MIVERDCFSFFLLQFFKILISLLSLTWHLIHQGNTGRKHNEGKHIYHVSLDYDSLSKKTFSSKNYFAFYDVLYAQSTRLLCSFEFSFHLRKIRQYLFIFRKQIFFKCVCFLLIELNLKTNGHIFYRRKPKQVGF